MNILIISNGMPTRQYPLNGIFEWDQAKALASIGHNVTYFALDLRSIRRKRKLGIYKEIKEGICIYTIAWPVGALPMSIFCKIGRKALRILYKKAYATMKKPEIIHAHFTDMGCIAADLAKTEKIPLVITEHSTAIDTKRPNKEIIKCAKHGYLAAEKVIAVSKNLAKKIKSLTGVSCTVIYNIIDPYEMFLDKKNKTHQDFTYISVSNLIKRKRIDLLIEAFKLVSEKNKNVYLTIVGDGPERSSLEKQAETLGINNRILFTGRLERSGIAVELDKADCFVLPSDLETFGVVYVEAMMKGLPVIATECGGPEEFVNDKVGIVVNKNDQEELARAMSAIYNQYNLYNPNEIREYAINKFSPTVIAKQITKLYKTILQE